MSSYPCTDNPNEVLDAVAGVKEAASSFKQALSDAAASAEGDAAKFAKFVNGGVTEEVQLGDGEPTPTLRNTVHLVKSAAAELDGSDVSGKFSDAANGGTELRMLADRFGDVANVKDFGAEGDGYIATSTAADDRPILFVCGGTSNMQGYAEEVAEGSISVSNAWYWDYGTNEWKTPVRDPMWSGGRGSMLPAFAQEVRTADPSRTLLFVNGGMGGSTLASTSWLNPYGNWSRYGGAQRRLSDMASHAVASLGQSYKDFVFGGVIWWGGGNDASRVASGQTTVQEFTADFEEELLSLHKVFGGAHVYYVTVSLPPDDDPASDLHAARVALRNAQASVVATYSWAHLGFDASVYDGVASAWTGADGIHLGQTATNAVGAGVGEAFEEANGLPGTKTVRTVSGTDDASAFTAFEAVSSDGKFIPGGGYRIGSKVYSWPLGRIGNGADNAGFAYAAGTVFDKGDRSLISAGVVDSSPLPMIAVSHDIELDEYISGEDPTKAVGIYAEHRISGNTSAKTASVIGYAESKASGASASSIGVAGKAVKKAASGTGDCTGVHALAVQESTEVGEVAALVGGVSQNVAGTKAEYAFSGAHSTACHLFSASTGSPASSAIQIDATGKGFWNAIAIDKSCFGRDGSGAGVEGTVGINFESCREDLFPETGIMFGKATRHIAFNYDSAFKIDASNTEIRGLTGSGSPAKLYLVGGGAYVGFNLETHAGSDRHGSTDVRAVINWVSKYTSGEIYDVIDDSGAVVIRLKDTTEGATEGADSNFLYIGHKAIYGKSGSNLGRGSSRWGTIYATDGTIDTSDENEKQSIDEIPEAVFRAWAKVRFCQFQFNDAVAEKGQNARLHVGVIAQRVKDAFESEGLDAFRYGLLCFDEWDDMYEEEIVVDAEEHVDEETGETVPAQTHVERRLVTPAGSRYGIRYTEALALECAYQRWRLEQIEARLNEFSGNGATPSGASPDNI